MRALALTLLVACTAAEPAPPPPAPAPTTGAAKAVKVTVLSTMLVGDAEAGIGEWGFAALVEVDGRRLLVDTGARPETVLKNAAELRIDLSTVTDVVLTHTHDDHTGGLVTLRRELQKRHRDALSRAHVGKDFFATRVFGSHEDDNSALRRAYEALGGTFVEHDKAEELVPHVWITGPVPRSSGERNWSQVGQIRRGSKLVEDTVPEDSSVVIDTPEGIVIVTGCGHAGIVNIADHAAKLRGSAKIAAIIGGLHLFTASADQIAMTGQRLKALGVAALLAAHCTGIEATYELRRLLGLTRTTAVVASVGSSWSRGRGIDPLALAK